MLAIPTSPPRVLAAFAAALALASCAHHGAMGPGAAGAHRHGTAPGAAAGSTGAAGHTMHGSSGGSTGTAAAAASSPGQMNMQAMCAAHRQMRDAPAGQQAAMMEQHMKGMSPDMRQRHMEMMRQHCN